MFWTLQIDSQNRIDEIQPLTYTFTAQGFLCNELTCPQGLSPGTKLTYDKPRSRRDTGRALFGSSISGAANLFSFLTA